MSLYLKPRQFWVDHFNDEKYVKLRNTILTSFSDIRFEEGPHKYYLHGEEITCVSNVTHLFEEKFDVMRVSQETYERNFNNPNSKYYQMTPEMIRADWKNTSKTACEHGTERHEFAECLFYFSTGQFDKILPAYKDRLEQTIDTGEYVFRADFPKEIAAAKFYQKLPDCYIPILAEAVVYDPELWYSGTFDLLMYYDATLNGKDDSQSGLLCMDWKTNKDLTKNFNDKRLLPPFEELRAMPLSLYKLQLSLYQNCLEKIGLKVVGRRIMWLKENEFEKINLEEYVSTLRQYLTEHPLKKK